jgi:hypothetical protein
VRRLGGGERRLGAEVVLSGPRRAALTALSIAIGLPGAALAAAPPKPKSVPVEEAPRAIREPVRLTAGASSELMGVLGAGEKALYFVSDASGTLDIMRQAPVQSGPVTLSSSLGDAAWPRVSPDGKHLAYISFQNDSTGDVCVRPLSDREAGPETCLTTTDSAELMVLWWDDVSLAVLSRRELHGDFQLLQVPIDGRPASLLVARDMVGISISPDRRWVAYVPLSKGSRDVGVTFSQRTALGIGIQRLSSAPASGKPGREQGPPTLYVPPLPGVTGSVAFSAKGNFLEFTQFLNDTNQDGIIDGDDNAVIFRVPFHGDSSAPLAAAGEPEQLTSARWDCHYPAPAPELLIASCSHEGSLDVYSLPLEGAVPHEWDDARLLGEIAVSRDLWTRLLLSARRLALAPNPVAKEAIVREMMALHLELGEYESTIYYAEKRLESPEGRRWGHVIAELAQHRRADLALIRGETSAAYIQSERARASSLREALPGAPPNLAQLTTLVVSEIEGDIGDKAAALATFQGLDLTTLADPLLAPLAARRAERLYRLEADRQALLAVYQTLSSLPLLSVGERLEYAQRFVDELTRGRSRAARAEALAAARTQTPDPSELALLLDVEKALLGLDKATEEAVRKQIFSLYTQNKDKDRRRALALATLRAAAIAGSEYVQYQFVTTWASSLDLGDPERKNAETLYDNIVLDRAYGEGRAGKIAESRGYFYGATIATDSLEAHIGFIEARLLEGGDAEKNLDEVYTKRFANRPDSPVYAFVRAYRIARQLPSMTDLDRHEQLVSKVVNYLERAAHALPKSAQVHQLWGFALHQRARRSGSREAAVAANREYLLALDLAAGDERLTATLLFRLGLLQASLGNHGQALRYLIERDQLPHVRPLEELGLAIAIANSAWHAGDTERAKAQMLRASALIEKTPSFASYAPLVLDRLGLALATAGDPKAAEARYAELGQLLERSSDATPLNLVKAHVGRAASALGSGEPEAALVALGAADHVLGESSELDPAPKVVWRRSLIGNYAYRPVQYRALVAGLRANADRALGNFPAALAAMERRVELLEKRLAESQADEDRLELAQAYHHLAELHYRLKDPHAAVIAVETGLALSDAFDRNTGSDVDDTGLALLRDYAELHLYGGVPESALHRDLRGDLRRAYTAICKYRSPRWSGQRFLFEAYLTALSLDESETHEDQRSSP